MAWCINTLNRSDTNADNTQNAKQIVITTEKTKMYQLAEKDRVLLCCVMHNCFASPTLNFVSSFQRRDACFGAEIYWKMVQFDCSPSHIKLSFALVYSFDLASFVITLHGSARSILLAVGKAQEQTDRQRM